ncbi:MAG: DUF2236 domain-containing protein [Gammaproteobacteria bacterium]|nr:DUF2236 domain-containing protein [Gammaproteobacteria bacterium]
MTVSPIHFELADDVTELKDYGLFGPDSVTWKVWSHPAAFIGLTRSFYIEVMGSVDASAALSDRGTYRTDPVGRLSRTMTYFLNVVFGDMETISKANARLYRLHSHIKGNTPITGGTYNAHDPLLMLGTHLITWHSVYYAYEKLVGKLTTDEERRYFEESVRFAKSLQEHTPNLTLEAVKLSAQQHGYDISSLEDLHDIPSTRKDFARVMALTASGAAITSQTRSILLTLLKPSIKTDDPQMNVLLRFYPILTFVVTTLIPKEMCELAGLPRSRWRDELAIMIGKAIAKTATIPHARKFFESKIGTSGYELMHRALQY